MGRWATATLLFLLTSAAAAQHFGETVIVSQQVAGDLYAAGQRVEIRAPVAGDAVMAGQRVHVAAPVGQDVIAAGESVTLTARVGDDVRAAGRHVRIENEVAGHLLALGAEVEVVQGARVGDYAWLAGNDVQIAGTIDGPVKIHGESVRISGHVRGNAAISARQLELLPGARIDGTLAWHGSEPRIAEGASVGGPIVGKPAGEEPEAAEAAAGIGLLFLATFAVTGLVLYLLFTRVADSGAAAIRQRPGLLAALGFAVLFLTPFLIVLLFATVIGWLLALILIALYLAALPVGGLLGTYGFTRMALGWARKEEATRLWRAVALVVAIIVVGLLQLVPVIGWLLSLLLLLWGLGAILTLLYHSTARTAPA